MNLSPMEQYWVWLSSIEGISLKRFYQLISVYGDARNVWDSALDDKMKEILPAAALKKLRDARSEGYFYALLSLIHI